MILPSIAKHANSHGIIPLKKYSQNFIFDSSLCDKIARVSLVKQGANILEVGPGTAGLTRSIISLLNPSSFTIVEKDRRCIALLNDIKTIYSNLNIIESDALDYKISNCADKTNIVDIISNLPYQIGTELLIRWLKQIDLISSITIMLQKEVVDKICAQIDSKLYGRLSVISQIICITEKCFNVSSKAFIPAPNVDSAVVRLVPREQTIDRDLINIIELITRFAFGQRRKMIKSSLKPLTPNIEILLKELDIDIAARAENLSPDDYVRIAASYSTL